MSIQQFSSLLPLAAAASLCWAWVLVRARATQWSHRRLAAALVPTAMLLPHLVLSLGLVGVRSATGVGLAALIVAVIEAVFVDRRRLPAYQGVVRNAWLALWIAVAGVHLLLLIRGVLPGLAQLHLFVGIGVLCWIRIDRELIEHGVAVVWTAFAGIMLALLPFGLLDASAVQESTLGITIDPAQSENSPYWNPVWSILGIQSRWSGMFTHPNALGAFAAMGVALALSGRRVAWPLLVLSTPLLFASASRTAGIAAAAGALSYVLIKGKLKSRLGVGAAAGALALVTVQSLAKDTQVLGGTGRVEIWKSVPSLLGTDWLSGIGGPQAGVQLVEAGLLPSWAARLHSVVFEHLLYSGVVGLVLVLVLILMLGRAAWNVRVAIPLFVVVLILALGDNYGDIFQMTMGVLGYITVIAVCTPPREKAHVLQLVLIWVRHSDGETWSATRVADQVDQ